MDLHLYNKSGGNPMCTAATELTLVGTTLIATMVTGQAGKKIVPIWMAATTDAFGTRPVKIDLRSAATDLISEAVQSENSWPMFMKFPDMRDKIGVAENLRVKIYGSGTDKFYVTIGYYVI